jgi:outer membrane protein OmpA-like peptidoglycan-associated protein
MHAVARLKFIALNCTQMPVSIKSDILQWETSMISRRSLIQGFAGAAVFAAAGFQTAEAQEAPSSEMILRKLQRAPSVSIAPEKKVSRQALKRRPDLRRIAPSIDIQAINFAFGSAAIPRSERWKVQEIADALNQLLDNNPDEVFLIEGHTDAVGTRIANQRLSQSRAASLKRDLGRYFGVPGYNLDTVGYGEDFLLVPTPYENWRNRRVTLRRITDVISPY